MVWLTAEATKRPSAVRAAYYWALESALCKYGIGIPFPQRDLHIVSAFGLERADAVRAWGRAPPPRGLEQPAQAQLQEHEREQLANNDAQQEVERQIAREQAEAAAREAAERAAASREASKE